MIKKIDLDKLGEQIVEWRDDKPFTSHVNPMVAAKEIAEKVNEIITHLNQNSQ